jgi:uncharacterized membrane protein
MRRVQLQEIFFSIVALVVFLISTRLISLLSNQQTSDYTTGWGNVGWSLVLTIFVAIPSLILSVVFAVAAILNEVKIYNEKKARKL